MGALSRRDRFAYALGDFGLNACWFTANTYLLFFYTDVLGIPAGQAGLIVLAGLVWDAATDPVMGLLAERTRTGLGRYRPFLFAGALPIAATLACAFARPDVSVPLVWWALGSHLALRTALTVVAVPYASLPTRITSEGVERARLSGWRVVFAMFGAFYASALTLPLVALFGGGARQGFGLAAGVTGLLAAAAILWCAKSLREPPAMRKGRAEESLPAPAALRAILHNPPLLILLSCSLLVAVGNAALAGAALYVFDHVWDAEALIPFGLGGALAGAVAGAPLWTAITTRLGHRWSWTFGFFVTTAALVPLWFLEPSIAGTAPFLLFVLGFGASSQAVVLGAALPDTVDYGEWHTGHRTESLPAAAVILFQKIGTGLGAFTLATALEVTGYSSNGAPPDSSLVAMRSAFVVIPLVTFAAAAVAFSGYGLTVARQERIVRVLRRRSNIGPAIEGHRS